MSLAPKTLAIIRQQSLRRMCYDGRGKLSKDAQFMAAYLSRFCNGDGRATAPVSPQTGMIDPLAMARLAGRREVFDLLARVLNMKIEDRHNLEEDK